MVKKTYNYVGNFDEKRMARAISKNQPASVKHSLEISRTIKGKKLDAAQKFLEDVAEKKRFLPLRVYNRKVAHRKGQSVEGVKSGRYPIKTCQRWLKLLKSVRSNADVKGLNVEKLKVIHANATRGFARVSYQSQGRISGKKREAKSAHLEIVVSEVKA
jgi:large subunit ribosomal protein L22